MDRGQCRHRCGEAMIRRIVKLLLLCLLSWALQAQNAGLTGAWLQRGIKWVSPPAELQLNQRSAEAAVLFFGAKNEFTMVYANVVRGPNSEGLSQGDGRVVYLGTWRADGVRWVVEYRIVSRTVSKAGETLPGPLERASVQLRNGSLLFEKMRFQRDRQLDNELRAIYDGETARLAAH